MSKKHYYHSDIVKDFGSGPKYYKGSRDIIFSKYFEEKDGLVIKGMEYISGSKYNYYYYNDVDETPTNKEYFIPKDLPTVRKESIFNWNKLDKSKFYNIYGTEKKFRLDKVTDFPFTFLYKNIKIMSFDIEVYADNTSNIFNKEKTIHQRFIYPITSISIVVQNNKNNKTLRYVLVNDINERKREKIENIDGFKVIYFNTEKSLLKFFIELIQKHNPDILTGWNIEYFDIPYIYVRISKLISEYETNFLSPYMDYIFSSNNRLKLNLQKLKLTEERNEKTKIVRNGQTIGTEVNTKINIAGINVIDYMKLYKQKNPSKDSYSLDSVSSKELELHKVNYDKYGTINRMFDEDLDLFVKYNMEDSRLVMKLEDKLGYFKLLSIEAGMVKIQNIVHGLSTVKPWENFISLNLKNKNMIELWIPKSERSFSRDTFPAALDLGVDDIVGTVQKYFFNYDFTSLYPTTIMSLNISPEKKVPISEEYGEFYESKNLIYDLYKKKDTLEDDKNNKFKQKVNSHYNTLGVNGNGIQDIDKVLLLCENKKYPDLCYGITSFYEKDSFGLIPEIILDVFNLRVAYKKMLVPMSQLLSNEIDLKTFEKKVKKLNLHHSDEYKTFVNSYKNNDIKECKVIKDLVNTIQDGLKLFMNSGYGAFGNKYFKYYDKDFAASVTLSARRILNELIQNVSTYMNEKLKSPDGFKRILYGATDSVFISMSDIFEKNKEYSNQEIVDKIFETFESIKMDEFFEKFYDHMGTIFNSIENFFNIEMEKIMLEGIWFGKKNYLLRKIFDKVLIPEGNKLTIKGLQLKKTNSPLFVRDEKLQKQLIDLIFDSRRMNNNVIDLDSYVLNLFDEFKSIGQKDPYQIGANMSVNPKMLTKYLDQNLMEIVHKQSPAQIKGIMVWNQLISRLDKKYEHYYVRNEGFSEKGCVITLNEEGENGLIFENDIFKLEKKKEETEKRVKKNKPRKEYTTSITLPTRFHIDEELKNIIVERINWYDQFDSTVFNLIEKYLPIDDIKGLKKKIKEHSILDG